MKIISFARNLSSKHKGFMYLEINLIKSCPLTWKCVKKKERPFLVVAMETVPVTQGGLCSKNRNEYLKSIDCLTNKVLVPQT